MEPSRDHGTTLAAGPAVRAYSTYRREALLRASSDWMRERPIWVLPLFLAQFLVLASSSYPRRLLAVYAVAQVIHITALFAWRRATLRGNDAARISILSHIQVVVSQSFFVGLTGGLHSPSVAAMVACTTGSLVGYGRSRESYLITAAAAGCIALVTLLPASMLGPQIPSPQFGVLMALSLGFSFTIHHKIVLGLVDAYHSAGTQLERAREDSLRDAQERVRALESVGAKLAHELKNPLAAIKALAQISASGKNPARAAERLGVALGEIERMEGILRDYLSFARPLEALRPEPVALDALAADAVELLAERASQSGVALRLEAEPVRVEADPRRLKSLLVDLLSNALDASSAGDDVTLSVQPESQGGALLTVRDTGAGMGVTELQRLGTPFYSTREGGTGLGVVLARSAAQQHGGSLEYASARGEGTTATLRLPARVAPEATALVGP